MAGAGESDACSGCAQPYKPGAAFCSACGLRRDATPPARVDIPPSELGLVLTLYLALLAVNIAAVSAVHRGGANPFLAELSATGAFFVIVVGFAAWRWRLVLPQYRPGTLSVKGYALILVAAPAVFVCVLGYVHGLVTLFGIHAFDELETVRPHGPAIAIAMIAIGPPVIEELAFRGLIFTGLARSFTIAESLIISSFAFALLHLAIPSLLTHLPLGLYFAWLRHRSGSLWPPMFAHFLHNLGVIVVGY